MADKAAMETQLELNEQTTQDETNPITENADGDENEMPAPTLSDVSMKQKSVRIRNQLRVIIDEEFRAEQQAESANKKNTGTSNKDFPQHNASSNGSSLNAPKTNSSIVLRTTSILIDEVPKDTVEYETTVIALPKSPMFVCIHLYIYVRSTYIFIDSCALLLMESIGIYQELDKTNRISIIASILITILAQIGAGGTIFTQQLYSEVDDSDLYDSPNDGFLNLVVIAYIVIYLASDCAQIYKQYVLLRWMRKADKLTKRSTALISLYLLTNIALYVFLLYYSVVELLINEDIGDKLEAAVAVYFILEVDDWLYFVTIEPLKILEDEIFNLSIKGKVGSRTKRLKYITYVFWGVFCFILLLQFFLFVFRVNNLTIDD